MEIKINLVISADSSLITALQVLAGQKTVSQTTVWAEPGADVNGTEKAEETKTTEKKTRTKKPAEEIAPTEEKKTFSEAVVKTDHTLDSIRAEAVPRSKAGHKTAIKAKITELGYDSLEDMQPEHFNEFYAFLQTFPKP